MTEPDLVCANCGGSITMHDARVRSFVGGYLSMVLQGKPNNDHGEFWLCKKCYTILYNILVGDKRLPGT